MTKVNDYPNNYNCNFSSRLESIKRFNQNGTIFILGYGDRILILCEIENTSLQDDIMENLTITPIKYYCWDTFSLVDISENMPTYEMKIEKRKITSISNAYYHILEYLDDELYELKKK